MWPWIAGSEVFTSRPQTVVLPDYPAVNEDREVAAAELDRLAPLGKILLYSDGSRPPHLSVCPSHLIIKEDKGRVGRDWSNHQYPLNSVLANPPSQYGTMDEFSQLLSPGPFMSRVDLQGCFLHWHGRRRASCRRFPRVRHPVSSPLWAYLFLPFGLDPVPGWNDYCVRMILKISLAKFPSLRALDTVGDLRFVDASGGPDALAASLAGLIPFLDDLGSR